MINFLQLISLGVKYHGLSKGERILKLIEEEHCRVRQAVVVTGVSIPQIYRVKKAKAEEREIRVRRRPKALRTEKETLLVIALMRQEKIKHL
jgi:hypothetical protein